MVVVDGGGGDEKIEGCIKYITWMEDGMASKVVYKFC